MRSTSEPAADDGSSPALAAAPFVFLVVFYVVPFVTLLAEAVAVDDVGDVLGRRRTWEVAWFTTWQATGQHGR